MNGSVYISATGSFLPNAPIGNDKIEEFLGFIGGRPSRSRTMILKSNQIQTRHFAMDPVTRKPTHNNAQLTASAVRDLLARNPDLNLKDVELLTCGTTVADLIVPAHGQMVQGELKDFAGEVITTSGVCCSSSSALKAAYLSVLAGDAKSAIVTGSEVASKFMRSEAFEAGGDQERMASFGHDFLRWMLSDGAGAVYLAPQPIPGKTNLKINWIEGRSYANEQPVCMFAGGHLEDNGDVTSWKDLQLESEGKPKKFVMNFQQDIRQLREMAPRYTIERPLTEIKKKRGLNPGDYTWFLPHYSSHFFREMLDETLLKIDFSIPQERWFTTLYEKGNIGSASILVFIDELVKQKQLSKGEKILCYAPESARFSVYFFELEVV